MNSAIRVVACAITVLIVTAASTPVASAIDIDENLTARMRVNNDGGIAEPSEFGEDWTDAYEDLQDALAAAAYVLQTFPQQVHSVELWVRGNGVEDPYYPGTTPEATFLMREKVQILGGFAGSETARDQRDFMAHETVLSGIEGTPGNPGTKNVVRAASVDDTAKINGFTITGGREPDDQRGGGGAYWSHSDAWIVNCRLTGNSAFCGGAIFAHFHLTSGPRIINCVVENNFTFECKQYRWGHVLR